MKHVRVFGHVQATNSLLRLWYLIADKEMVVNFCLCPRNSFHVCCVQMTSAITFLSLNPLLEVVSENASSNYQIDIRSQEEGHDSTTNVPN